MPYDKQTWVDGTAGGTPLRDERLNHVEDGLADTAATLDAMVDQVAALAAGKAPTAVAKIAGGTTAGRPPPTLDAVYRDHDLGRVMYGTGTKWVTGRGADVAGPSAGNAPQNFAAVVQPDNSVICTWLPVVGATSYKLYEIQSPGGVVGATVLSTTTVTRVAGTFRTYEYWVTAIVGSAETAPSNHALATLPFGGGTTGIGSPAALLGLGTTGGFWNVGVGYSTGHVDYTFGTLSPGATFPPYYVLNAAGTAVQFQVFMNGATLDTSTTFERCELRELGNDGVTKAAWTAASGTHSLEYSFKVNHVQPKKPEVIVGHLCDAAGEAVTIRVTGATSSALNVVAAIYGTDQAPTLVAGYVPGTTVKIKLELIDGTLKIYVNGTLKVTSTTLSAAVAPVAWTAQLYVATTGNDANAGTLRSLPKKTIAAALAAANPGDTIAVVSGSYPGNVVTSKGGTAAGGYITIRSEVPRGAIIVGNGSTTDQAGISINHQYIRIRDMSITGPGGEGSGAREGVMVNADNVEVRGCNIYNLCKWQTAGTSWQGGAGIDFGGPNRVNITIDGNEIHNIGVAPGNDTLVHGIYCGVHGTNFRIINNLIYGCEDFGVHPYDETESSGIQIINNTICGNGRGILQAPNGITRNNIVYNCMSMNYEIRGSGNVLSNNFSGGGGNVSLSGVTSGIDAKFIRYAIDSTGDFHLQSASPCLNAGTLTGAPDHDMVGTARPQGSAVDAGCLESVTAASGVGTAASGFYYRLGTFPQSSAVAGGFELPAEYCSVDISGLTVVHVPPLGVTVTSDDGVEAAKLLGWGAPIDGDEFEYTGPPASAKWSMYDGPGHDGNGLRRPSAFNVANGILTCTGDNVSGGTTGGMAFYRNDKYCRVEWRVRAYPITPGSSGNKYHPVIIDWPQSDVWPQDGEYDFYECDIDSGKYEAYLHIPGNDGGAQEYVSKTCDISQWHNIAFEWTSAGIKGWLDGVQVFAYSGSYILAPGPMHMTFQLDNFAGSNMQPARFEAKWFRLYTKPS